MKQTKQQPTKYLVKIAYDGSEFHGWAKQTKLITVEGLINRILSKIFHLPIIIQGASRTDSGVHAKAQFFTFNLPFHKAEAVIKQILTQKLPQSIHVLTVAIVDNNFDLLHRVLNKTYQYFINIGELNPFQSKYQYFIGQPLAIDKMQEVFDCFIGTHYFYNFSGLAADSNKSRSRTISAISVVQLGEQIIVTITGNGFLRYQIRYLVACAVDYVQARLSLSDVKNYLKPTCQQKYRFKKLPPVGLYLLTINFKS